MCLHFCIHNVSGSNFYPTVLCWGWKEVNVLEAFLSTMTFSVSTTYCLFISFKNKETTTKMSAKYIPFLLFSSLLNIVSREKKGKY